MCMMYIVYIMSFIRKIKKPSGTYLAEVESVWENGKTRQKVIRYIGKEVEGKPVRRIASSSVKVKAVKRHLDIEIINRIAAELGITVLRPEILAMVYSQLLDRPSINGMEEWLSHTDMLEILGVDCMSTSMLYDALEELEEMDFSPIEASLSSIFSSIDEKNAVIIDITDTYFEGESMGGDPRRGKEEKVKKLMQIALAVTEKHGFPLFHRTYGGNISGRRIFREMISILRERGYESTIMDRGFYSRRNIKDALNLNVSIICGVIKDAEFRKILLEMQKDLIYRKENRIELKNTHVYAKSMDFMSGKIIMVYNPMLESIRREHYYEHSGDEEIASLLGYSLVYHNTSLSDRDVVRKYYAKDTVERVFRQMKGIISLRPVRVWPLSHVYGHIKVCYLAYAILTMLQHRIEGTGMSGSDALELLSHGYRVHLMDSESGLEWKAEVELSKKQEEIRNLVYKSQ